VNTILFGDTLREDSELYGEVFNTRDFRDTVVKKGEVALDFELDEKCMRPCRFLVVMVTWQSRPLSTITGFLVDWGFVRGRGRVE
jgi:hypothetical protein